MKKILLPLALVLGFLIGWSAARSGDQEITSRQETVRISEEPAAIERSTETELVVPDQTIPEDLAQLTLEEKLVRIEDLKESKSLTNTIASLNLIASMSEAELKYFLSDTPDGRLGGVDDFILPYYSLRALVEKDPESVYDFYLDEAELMKKKIYTQSLFSVVTTGDPDLALRIINEQMTGRERDNYLGDVITQLAGDSPETAIGLIATLPYGRTYENAVRTVASKWGSKDPLAALQWVRSLEEGQEKNSALDVVFSAFSRVKADEAKDFLATMPAGKEKEKLIGQLGKSLARENPQEAILWANSLENEAYTKLALDRAIFSWSDKDPVEAIEYLEFSGDTRRLNDNILMLSTRYAWRDVQAAAEWAITIENENARKQAFDRVATEYLQQNTEKASVWIASLESSPERDRVVRQLVNKVLLSDPSAAFGWAATIDNENQRRSAAQQAVFVLINKDKNDEARELIASSELSATDQEFLSERLK